ncbi:hypothetical protein MRB53_040495 [Persea americana]|nr:hypothetical protein MRB53_040495 [Persea americana]
MGVKRIWPRDEKGMIDTQSLAVAGLRYLLASGAIRPHKIIVKTYLPQGYLSNDIRAGVESVAAFLQEITENIPLAILSLKLAHHSSRLTVAQLQLAPKHQGQHVGSSCSVLLVFAATMTRALIGRRSFSTNSPALEELALFNWTEGVLGDAAQDIPPTRPVEFKLKVFRFGRSKTSRSRIATVLQSSYNTPSELQFWMIMLEKPATWRELLNTLGATMFDAYLVHADQSSRTIF